MSLFFGLKVRAPWPESWPKGRVIDEGDRHCTLAFLRVETKEALSQGWEKRAVPPFKEAPYGWFNRSVLLPPASPRVVAWEVCWNCPKLYLYRQELVHWLLEKGLCRDQHEWLPHVSLVRKKVEWEAWQRAFRMLPLFAESVDLFKSLGHSQYQSVWSFPFVPPFVEVEHTADLAFDITGSSIEQLYQHALLALAFKASISLSHKRLAVKVESLDDIVIALNDIIQETDLLRGCPLKGVSFHGKIEKLEERLKWEMIVDV